MLSASDGANGAGGDREGSAADRESSFRVIGRQRATRRIAIPIAMRERRIDALIQKPEVPLALGREALFHQRLDALHHRVPDLVEGLGRSPAMMNPEFPVMNEVGRGIAPGG